MCVCTIASPRRSLPMLLGFARRWLGAFAKAVFEWAHFQAANQ